LPSAKTARVAERKRLQNQPIRSKVKTFVTKARRAMASDDIDTATAAAHDAAVALDKAAQKGVIHPNNAARRKSRIMKQLYAAQSK
jgi:small subunit ribosomal protein S20